MSAKPWTVIYCRLFQAVLKIGHYFVGYRMPEYLEGAGMIKKLSPFMQEKGLHAPLVVTDRGMVQRSQVQPMLEGFEKNGIQYALHILEKSNPTDMDVETGYAVFCQQHCQCIIAIGGGSAMDCAKAIAAKCAQPKKSVAQLQGLFRVHRKVPTLLTIPTTAGTGSETTLAAVITDTKTHRKASINDPVLIPRYAVLDAELTATLPPYLTAITGMDALSHAVECYTNHTYNTPLENKLARQAAQMIYENLPKVYENGGDMEARQKMQLAAFYAGRAFTRGCVGNVHALGHPLGSLYGIDHGLAMAVLLPQVMRSYGEKAHKRLAELADACGIKGQSDAEKANALLQWMEDVNKKMNLPAGFPQIREEDVEQIVTWAQKESNPLYPVPVVWGKEEMQNILHQLMAG